MSEKKDIFLLLREKKKKKKNLEILDYISTLRSGWNGYDAQKFSRFDIGFFKGIIEHIYRQPDIAPTARRSLLFRYVPGDGNELAFEVSRESVYMVIYQKKGNTTSVSDKFFKDSFIHQMNSEIIQFYKKLNQ